MTSDCFNVNKYRKNYINTISLGVNYLDTFQFAILHNLADFSISRYVYIRVSYVRSNFDSNK